MLSLLILYWKVPDTPSVKYHFNDTSTSNLLKDKNLLIMNLSAFLQKFLMIFAFVCISLALTHHFSLTEGDLWKVYAPAALVGVFAMGPSSIFAQKKGQFKAVMLFGIFAFVLSYFLMAFATPQENLLLFAAGVLVFLSALPFTNLLCNPLLVAILKLIKKVQPLVFLPHLAMWVQPLAECAVGGCMKR